MDEEDEDWSTLQDIAASQGLILSQYNVVKSENAYLLNEGQVPDYDAPWKDVYTDVVPREAFRKDGSFYQQARPRTGGNNKSVGGDFGRLVNNKTKKDLQEVLISCYVENYHKENINVHTGALLESVKDGQFTDQGGEALFRFTFQIADIPGRDRPSFAKGKKNFTPRPSTLYYGPRVFYGRAAIFTPHSHMRFLYKGGLVQTDHVGAAPPRNIFILDSGQIDRLNNVILRPISNELKKQIKEILEDKGKDSNASGD